MIAIEVRRCAACGALEDLHTITHADGSVTIELTPPCGHEETRMVELARGQGYWFEIPVQKHTMDGVKGDADGNDQNPGEGDL